MERGALSSAMRRCGVTTVALMGCCAAALAQDTSAEVGARLTAEQRRSYETYRKARALFDREADSYWEKTNDKRAERRRKRGSGEAITPDDYVFNQPPKYAGPVLPPDVARIIAELQPPRPETPVPVLADYLASAKENYGFVPQPTTEREFKRRYAEEALRLGLSKDQVIRVYALETGGRGTYDMQAGIGPDTKGGKAISSALGYAQLLGANSVDELVKHGGTFIERLQGLAARSGTSTARAQQLKAKVGVLRAMLRIARSVPNEWSHHVQLATTQKGLGIHALNLDADIGPWLQVIKLQGLREEAAKAGRTRLTGGEIELMNLAGPRTGLEMMEPPARGAATANFFARAAYDRNTIVRGKTAGELLKALDERMDINVTRPGAVEFAQVFDEVIRQQRAAR